mmetsp:Transcript_44240/g.134071  ORF Transcript_44240/g.134071 Transcript_44240/m.134071 type:complete len:219 (+) Transcript_44240:1782-2438(+)
MPATDADGAANEAGKPQAQSSSTPLKRAFTSVAAVRAATGSSASMARRRASCPSASASSARSSVSGQKLGAMASASKRLPTRQLCSLVTTRSQMTKPQYGARSGFSQTSKEMAVDADALCAERSWNSSRRCNSVAFAEYIRARSRGRTKHPLRPSAYWTEYPVTFSKFGDTYTNGRSGPSRSVIVIASTSLCTSAKSASQSGGRSAKAAAQRAPCLGT